MKNQNTSEQNTSLARRIDWKKVDWSKYDRRIEELMAEGMDHSDAEGVLEVELMEEQA